MKKKIGFSAIAIVLVAVCVVLVTVRDTGKKERPGLGYEDRDVFETGLVEGEFTAGPINEDFLDFPLGPKDADIRYKKQIPENEGGLGLIPSPVPEEVHDGIRAKAIRADSIYDERYDLRDPDNDGSMSDSLLPPAREQWDCGACWAFSSYGGIEGLLLSRMGHLADYSENNVLYSSGYDWNGCEGGNVDMAMAYLARGDGPVSEADDPFSKDSKSARANCKPVRYVDSVVKLKVRASVADVFYIKQALLERGPLYVSMNWSRSSFNSSDNTYYSDSFGSNHAVTLVGWDDGKNVEGAPYPGAFIVRNSWGTDWGEDGYFYVSYDDRSLAFSSLVAFRDEPDALLPFDRIYYYDDLGMTSSTGFGKNQAWGACVFTPEENGDLIAVGMFTTSYATSYEINVYDGLESGKLGRRLWGPMSGSLTGKGYHTVRLDSPPGVAEGDDFAVAVKFHTPESTWPVPLERPFPEYSSAAHANAGETFLSHDGVTFRDTTATFPDTSVCIKAFVRERSCDDKSLKVSGPGDAGMFLTPEKKGTFVTAVVTNGCGEPVYDADVIATFTASHPDLALYDDGEHNDGSVNDGIYANGVEFTEGIDSVGIMVKAMLGNRETYASGDAQQTPAAQGSSGGGCFLGVAGTL